MKLKKESKTKILALSLLVLTSLIGLTGCSRITLHPISKLDIVEMQKGESYTPEKDGYFISEFYMEKVIEAKVKK